MGVVEVNKASGVSLIFILVEGPVFSRRIFINRLKLGAEVTRADITTVSGDIFNLHIGGDQQVCRFFKPVLVDIDRRGPAQLPAEGPVTLPTADMGALCHILYLDILHVITGNKGKHLFNTGRQAAGDSRLKLGPVFLVETEDDTAQLVADQ